MADDPPSAAGLVAQAYGDVLHPAAKRIGEIAGRAVGVALSPILAVVWGAERVVQYVGDSLKEKLRSVPPERIVSPPANVAGPVLEALRFSGPIQELREMYAQLLATAMDRDSALNAHPSFAYIIQELTPDEARILRFWAQPAYVEKIFPVLDVRRVEEGAEGWSNVLVGEWTMPMIASCEHAELGPTYLMNLIRLGLVQSDSTEKLAGPNAESIYAQASKLPAVVAALAQASDGPKARGKIHPRMARMTPLGQRFVTACVQPGADAREGPG